MGKIYENGICNMLGQGYSRFCWGLETPQGAVIAAVTGARSPIKSCNPLLGRTVPEQSGRDSLHVSNAVRPLFFAPWKAHKEQVEKVQARGFEGGKQIDLNRSVFSKLIRNAPAGSREIEIVKRHAILIDKGLTARQTAMIRDTEAPKNLALFFKRTGPGKPGRDCLRVVNQSAFSCSESRSYDIRPVFLTDTATQKKPHKQEVQK